MFICYFTIKTIFFDKKVTCKDFKFAFKMQKKKIKK